MNQNCDAIYLNPYIGELSQIFCDLDTFAKKFLIYTFSILFYHYFTANKYNIDCITFHVISKSDRLLYLQKFGNNFHIDANEIIRIVANF